MADANENVKPAAANRPDPDAASPADARRAAPLNPPGVDPRPEAGPGASDGYSGGGPGGGLLDAESGMRLGDDVADKANPDEDRKRLFPDAADRDEQEEENPAEAQPE